MAEWGRNSGTHYCLDILSRYFETNCQGKPKEETRVIILSEDVDATETYLMGFSSRYRLII